MGFGVFFFTMIPMWGSILPSELLEKIAPKLTTVVS